MLKIIRKADIILFFVLVALGALLFFTGFVRNSSDPSDLADAVVEVRVGGKLYGTYDLDTNQEVLVNQGSHLNKVIIKEMQVQMIEASCHNQVCIKQGTISRPGETIICLPNRVVVEIVSAGSGGDVDVISG